MTAVERATHPVAARRAHAVAIDAGSRRGPWSGSAAIPSCCAGQVSPSGVPSTALAGSTELANRLADEVRTYAVAVRSNVESLLETAFPSRAYYVRGLGSDLSTDMALRIAGYGLPGTIPPFPQDVLDDVT